MSKTTTIQYQKTSDHPIWSTAFRNGNARALLKRPYSSGAIEILPGVSSLDPKFHNFLRNAAAELNDSIDRGTTDGWAGPSGTSSDFRIMMCAAGVRGTPSGYVVHNNARLRADNELSNDGPSATQLTIFRKLCDLMFSEYVRTAVSIANHSSSGLSEIEFDGKMKKQKFLRTFGPDSINDTLRAWKLRDIAYFLEHGNLPCYVQNYRLSPDVPGKKRYAADLEYATTGGASGKRFEIDKRVWYPNGQLAQDIGALRPRHVQGFNNAFNLLFAVWRSGTMKVAHEKYAFTWKHRGGDDIGAKVNTWLRDKQNAVCYGIDVTQFDNSCPDWVLNEFCDYGAGRFFSEEFADLARYAFHAPVYQPETGDGEGGVFHGNVLEFETLEAPGLMSGVDFVAVIGKLTNMFSYFATLEQLVGTSSVLDRMDDILRGLDPDFGQMNMGDDGILFFSDPEVAKSFFSINNGVLKAELEQGLKFLGFVLQRDSSGTVTAVNDVVSFCRGIFVPERAWDSKFRRYWHIGLAEKFRLYASSPSFSKVLSIIDREWSNSYRDMGTFSNFAEYLITANQYDRPENALTDIDIDALIHPERVRYMYEREDLSPEILALFDSAVLMPDELEHIVAHHIKSTILE